jgi:hypothetical protein
MVLTAIVSNAAGLLTLVGDPATFLIGSSIGMSFGEYLRRVSLGGVLALLVIVPLLPVLMRGVWRLRRPLPPPVARARLVRPVYAACSLAVLGTMIVLFVLGERLPTRVLPPMVAMIASALALLVGFAARVEPTDNVLRDVDWKTLLFLGSIFCLVQAVAKTGLLPLLALKLYAVFGTQLTLVALTMIAGIGLLSAVLANVPVAAASILVVKGYLVAAEARCRARCQLHAMARGDDSRVRRNDVRCDARRKCHADRRVRQHRVRRHLRAPWQHAHVREVPALRAADHRGPACGVGDLCPRAVAVDELASFKFYLRVRPWLFMDARRVDQVAGSAYRL